MLRTMLREFRLGADRRRGRSGCTAAESHSRQEEAAAQWSIGGSTAAQSDTPKCWTRRPRHDCWIRMRAVVITKHGDLSVLQVQERPDPPPPAAGQVRIAVRAAGVNFADHLARVGLYPDAPKPPSVVGYEVAGTIEAVGDGVDPARVGERVFAGTRFGGYAEIVNVQAADAVPLPDALSFEQGAAIPVNYATAWAALHGYGSLRRRRAGVDSRGGGRRRHRGDPTGQGGRCGDPRHRVAGQASATRRVGRRPGHRLPPRRLVERLAAVRHCAGRASAANH